MGDSWLYKFTIVPRHLVGRIAIDADMPMSLISSLRRNDHHGNVSGVLTLGDETSFKPMLDVFKMRTAKIKSFGSYMWLSNETDKYILLPKGLVEQVAIKMVGISRDKAGLKKCLNTMQTLVRSEKISIPNSMRLDCCIYGSAMAFLLCLEDEITVFNRLCTPSKIKLYEQLNNIMSLQSFDSIFDWLPFCGKNMSLSETLPGVANVRSVGAVTVDSYERDRSSQAGPTFDALKAWPNGLPGVESYKLLSKIRKGATLARVDREKIEDKPQFFPICTTFSNYIPVVPYASANNEAVSLANRALMEVPEPDQESWDYLKLWSIREKVRFKSIDSTDLDGDFKEWNDRFVKGRRTAQEAAWESLKTTPLHKGDFKRKQFVKRELTMKGGPDPEDFDPRAIQANEDRLNASFGPFVHKVSNQLKELWNPDYYITYTAGMTAEEIGSWRGQFGDQDVTLLEMDESRYDAHQGEQCYTLFDGVLQRCDIGDYGDAKLASTSMKKIQGYSSHGIKYSVDYTMTSGSPTTSVSNSYLNGIKTAYILHSFGLRNFRILVHGDDNLVAIHGIMSPERKANLEKYILETNKKLGFTTKLKIKHEWYEVEYCSSLFWPVTDGFVLGPKIGKRLPKIGFSLRKLDIGEVKGMLLGLRVEAGYIPVLGAYAKHQLGLLKKTAKKSYVDDRSVYKSLASSNHKPNDDTFSFFEERYGITAREAEEQLLSVLSKNLTDCVDYNLLEDFTTKDL